MNTIALKITLLEPTLVLMFGSGDANQQESHDYIPGSVLHNMVAARYIKQHQLQEDGAYNATCRELFFTDKVRFLNGYPLDHEGKRALPTPLSWCANKNELAEFEKSQKLTITDFSFEAELAEAKPVNKPFCSWGEVIEFAAVSKQVMVHNGRNTRRVVAQGSSQLFQYEALAAKQTFMSLIMADKEVDLTPLRQVLSGEFTIGKSRSAGYGRVKITLLEGDAGAEYQPSEDFAEARSDEFVVITLLSDALVRDGTGSYTTDLGTILGGQAENCFVKTCIIGGFNRKWGLPLPQVQAIQKGSVFVFKTAQIDTNKLAEYQRQGLGERRAEGFGRIAVNGHRYETLQAKKYQANHTAEDVLLNANLHEGQLAQRIVEVQLRRELDQQLLTKVADLAIIGTLSKSLLSRIRLAARQALEQKSLEPLENFLKNVVGKKAGKELERCRIGKVTFYDWLQEQSKPGAIQKILTGQSMTVGGISIQFKESIPLQLEYTARFIEGVVKHQLDDLRQKDGQNHD